MAAVCSCVMQKPLTAPHMAPTTMPPNMATGTGMPLLTSRAAATPASASTEPELRSMPPVMMTQVAAMPR